MNDLAISVHQGSHAKVESSRLQTTGRPALTLTWQVEIAGRAQRVSAEASPLPGYGDDSFARCEEELRAVDASKLKKIAETLVAWEHVLAVDVERTLCEWSQSFKSKAARFALEVLIVGAAAGARGVSPWRLLASARPPQRLKTSAVVDPLSSDVIEIVRRACGEGIFTFKLKVGRDERAELAACEAISKLAQSSEPLRLRLDPNGAWDLPTARRLSHEYSRYDVEWIEDPTSDPAEWAQIESPIPLAIDEPLGAIGAGEALATGAEIFVLKPMALGGYSACLKWARIAEAGARQVSVSHLFDGPVAFDATVQLAFALQSPALVPGLGFHQALRSGWSSKPSFVDGTELVLPEAPA